jgi:hypothetical protein
MIASAVVVRGISLVGGLAVSYSFIVHTPAPMGQWIPDGFDDGIGGESKVLRGILKGRT